jgi:hypothetical protein
VAAEAEEAEAVVAARNSTNVPANVVVAAEAVAVVATVMWAVVDRSNRRSNPRYIFPGPRSSRGLVISA